MARLAWRDGRVASAALSPVAPPVPASVSPGVPPVSPGWGVYLGMGQALVAFGHNLRLLV